MTNFGYLAVGVSDFRIDVDHRSRRVIVSGELDFATTPVLTIAATTLQRTAGDLTIDLLDVTFIDAGGLGALVGLRARQEEQQAKLRVIAGADVARLAGLCGLSSLINTEFGRTPLHTVWNP